MGKESKVFTVIVGDLARSRNSPDRQRLSYKIRSAINQVSGEYRKEFYAPLVLTRGIDELSGVLKRPNMSYRICRLLNDIIHSRFFRFAVVRDTLDVAVTSRDAARMDGPAFHTASDIMQRAKRENLCYCFSLGFEFAKFDPWLNEMANLLHILRSGWSAHQRCVVQLYEKLGNQKTAAKRLGITQQAVSDALRQGYWKELKRAENMIDDALASCNCYK